MGLITLTRVFAALTTALPSYLDDNFTTIVNLLNGNLDENNVSKAADSLKGGGYSVNSTPTANNIPVLGSDSRLPFAASAALRGALVSKSAAQSISNTTATALTWDQESYDTDTIHDNATNNSRLTIPTGITKAKFIANISWASNATGYREVMLYKGGVLVASMDLITYPASSGECGQVFVSPVLTVAAGEYYELYVKQSSGGALNVNNTNTSFSIELVE